MKSKTVLTKIVFTLMAMSLTVPAWAGNNPIPDLAQATGLSERKVRMLLGVRTAYAEYPYTYTRAREQFEAALGKDAYQRLMNGEAIALRIDGQIRVVSLGRAPADLANTL